MVYESDFYTTRRPYRPSSYSVTAELIYRPPRTVTRLAYHSEPPHHQVRIRVRPSIILRELDRIQYKRRPHVGWSAVDDFYRAESTKNFQDETRRIRADTASLLQRARSVVPRAKSVAPIDTVFSYSYGEPVGYRFSNDAYIDRLLMPLRSVNNNVYNISFYPNPASRFTGRGHLACIHYSGSKGFSNRRPLYKELSIRDDVNLLSFYAKNRLAAAGLAVDAATVKLLPWRPTRKFQPMKVMDDPKEELKAFKAEREARFRASTLEPDFAPVDLAEIKKQKQEEARAAEEKALKEEAKREAERKDKAERDAAEKKRAEEESQRRAEKARQAEEQARRLEEERLAEEARLEEEALAAEEAKLAEEARLAEEENLAEEARKVEEERLAEEEREAARLAEEEKAAEKARLAQEARLAEQARIAEEARLAEEAKLAEESRLADEARLEEERLAEELARLEELERQAEEDCEADLARQAAELAEIARQESEIAAARVEELSRSGSAADILDDVSESHDAEPVVEEPQTPSIDALEEDQPAADTDAANNAADVSEDEQAEPDLTDEE